MTRAELRAELACGLGSAREAEWILEDVLGRPSAARAAPVDAAGAAAARALAERRRAGEPLQYVLGRWPFRRIELGVDRRALIPRPETEELVDVALAELGAPRACPLRVADLGTGSGALALSLADELLAVSGDLEVWAVDDRPEALELARSNLARLGDLPVHLRAGSWWQGLPEALRGRLDLVVSNPPYVSAAEWSDLDPVVRDHEPRHALVAADGPGGVPGFAAVAEVLAAGPDWLARPGVVVVEMAPAHTGAAAALALAAGYHSAKVRADLSGRARFVVARCGAP